MNIIDPCATVTISVPSYTMTSYDYLGSVQLLAALTASDISCTIQYSCGINSNICFDGTLNIVTGAWSFISNDMITHPPGLYDVEIVGEITGYPASFIVISIPFTVDDPCLSTILTIVGVADQNLVVNGAPVQV